MHRIANTNELQTELRRILAYAQSEQPSRQRIAVALEDLSRRVHATAPRTARSDGQEFYDIMKEEWGHVEYNEKTGRGSARAGGLGTIHWVESGNEGAVIVTIDTFPRIKARAEDAAKALEAIAEIVKNTGL